MSDAGTTASAVSYRTEHATVSVGQTELPIRILSPDEGRLAPRPLLLLSIALDVDTSLGMEPYNIAAMKFLDEGHRVVGYDLPFHGARVNELGEGIIGYRNAFVAGQDPFALFLREAGAILDHCIAAGIAEAGRIVVHGTSRSGYMAFRLLAVDDRVSGIAAMAPVTDWRMLTEFHTDVDSEDVANLRLSRIADQLVGKSMFAIMGNNDERVSTASYARFVADVMEAHERQGQAPSHVHFEIVDLPGHTSRPGWYTKSAEFLLEKFAG